MRLCRHCVLTANGAGKTTTLKCLTGLLTPSGGDARVLGHVPWRREHAFRRRFALVLGQKSGLWWDIPAQEGFLLQKEIYQIPDARYHARLAELVETMGVGGLLSTPLRQLSLGERMKMELIASLLHGPEMLFLDEPTIGLDLVSQERVRAFLRDHSARHGTTVVLTSHYMEDIRALCPRIIVVGQGTVAYDGALQALIDGYGGERRLRVTLGSASVRPDDLARFGRVLRVQDGPPTVAHLAVPRQAVARVSAAILQNLPVTDLTIAEPSPEDVLRRLYEAGEARG